MRSHTFTGFHESSIPTLVWDKHRPEKGKKQQLRSSRTRDQLLTAAERVFVRDGYEKAALADIAKMAGKTRGAVYSHFKDKEDLFLSLLAGRASVHGIRIRELLAELKTGDGISSSLRQCVSRMVDSFDSVVLLMEFQLYAVRHPHIQKLLNALPMPNGVMWSTRDENAVSFGSSFIEETAAVFKAIAVLEALQIGVRSASLSWDKPAVEAVATGLLIDIFQSFFEGKPSSVEG